jgi:hypothetical protein
MHFFKDLAAYVHARTAHVPEPALEGVIHYELLERNLTVTAERYCQQLKQSSKNAQFNDME